MAAEQDEFVKHLEFDQASEKTGEVEREAVAAPPSVGESKSAQSVRAEPSPLPPDSTGTGGDGGGGDATHEMAVLSSCNAADFTVGEMGMVLRVKCTRAGHPFPNKDYALKVVFNFGATTYSAVRNLYTAEYETVSSLPRHRNITPYWAQFRDSIPASIIEVLPEEVKRIVTTNEAGRRRRTPLHTQFVLFESGGDTLKSVRAHIDEDLLSFTKLWQWSTDVIDGLLHLEKHNIVHRDLKLDNVLVNASGKCQLVDFGLAIRVDANTRSIPFTTGSTAGGNMAHLAPEVLTANARVTSTPGLSVDMPYADQPVFALGVLMSELAIGEHPLPNYPSEYQAPGGAVQYPDDAILPLPDAYPAPAVDILRRMVLCDPSQRPSLSEVRDTLAECAIASSTDPAVQLLRTQLAKARATIRALRAELREAQCEVDRARKGERDAQAELRAETTKREAAERSVKLSAQHATTTPPTSRTSGGAAAGAGGGSTGGVRAEEGNGTGSAAGVEEAKTSGNKPSEHKLEEAAAAAGDVHALPSRSVDEVKSKAVALSKMLSQDITSVQNVHNTAIQVSALAKLHPDNPGYMLQSDVGTLLVRALNAHRRHEPTAVETMRALKDLAGKAANKKLLGAAGCVAEVVLCMHDSPMSANIQAMGARTLWDLCFKNAGNKAAVRMESGIQVLLLALRNHPRNVNVHRKVLGALFNLAVIRENKDMIRASNGIRLLLLSLSTHAHDATVQRNGCWALWNLAAGSETNRNHIFVQDGVRTVVSTLTRHVDVASVCEKALGLLDNLGVDPSHADAIARQGLAAIINAMKTHGRTAMESAGSAASVQAVQENGAGLLWSLAFSGEANRECVWRAGGVERLLECMEDYPDAVVLQENCCGALWNLSTKAAHKESLGEKGAIELILRAMARHPGRATLQKNALAALWDLNFLARENKLRISSAGGIKHVLEAMRNHPTSAEVQHKAMGVLFNVAVIPENKPKIIALHGIDRIVAAMRGHSHNHLVQRNACWALWNLAAQSSKSRRAIARSDAVTLVLDALTNHRDDSPEHQSVHQKGTGVIDNLAVSLANRESIRTLGAVPIIIMSMNTYPDDSDIQQNACGALWNLSVYPSEPDMEARWKRDIIERRGIVAVVRALRCHEGVGLVQYHGLGVLRNLIGVNADDSGLVDVVLGAMRANETHVGVQEQGCAALAELAAKGRRNAEEINHLGGVELVKNAARLHPHSTDIVAHVQRVIRLCTGTG